MKKILLAVLLSGAATALSAHADSDSTATLTFSGYVEPYYSYDFNRPSATGNRPGFLYSYNRHNEVNLNLGFVKAAYAARRVRANAAIGAGTYLNANYAAEPGVLKNVYEMNAGLRLSTKHDLWLDAGIFGSHIGFESAIGRDCRTLTRSLAAENSPYYEAGVKLTYTSPNGQWLLSGLLLNGWQRIQRVPGNSLPSLGTQIQFKPTSRVTLNSSTFVGTDKPDAARQMRYFHNLYGIFQLNHHWEATLGLDTGWEQVRPESSDFNTWYTPVAILRYAPNSRWAVAARGEYYRDANGVIVASGTPNGFEVLGLSLNVDYAVLPNALLRVEGRWLGSTGDAIFTRYNGATTRNNAALATALAVAF
jgi:hypothetical protein